MENKSGSGYVFKGSRGEFRVSEDERGLIQAALLNLLNEFEDIRGSAKGLEHGVADYRVSQLERLLEKFEELD